MPIAGGDLEFRLSNPSASGGNQLDQDDGGASLGGYLSRTVWGGVKHDLFAAVTGDENATQAVEYRCVFVVNKHATLTWTSPVLWFPSSISGGAVHAVGVDPTPASAVNADAQQAVKVASKYTLPAGVVFSAPTTKGAGLALGNIGPGQCRAFWVRRAAMNTAGAADDGFTIRAEGDTV